MINAIDIAQRRSGWDPAVIKYLYEEFIDSQESGDFLDYIADQVATAAFVIAASNGLGLGQSLEAYAHGLESVLNEEFSIDEALDSIYAVEE
jgi:hypothetical protein